jgi:hypothetical protein
MTAPWRMLSGAAAVALSVGLATAAWAAEPSDNRCWGEVASQLAQSVDDDNDGVNATGGGMGAHSRSPQGAEQVGGFATTGIIPQPRDGVGNVSRDVHDTDPSDGGNGQHAANNGEVLALGLDPVDGSGGGEALECSTLDGVNPFVP